MWKLTKPDGNQGEPSTPEDRPPPGILANYLGAVVTLLAGVLACAASAPAQSHQRANSALCINVTVMPVVTALRDAKWILSSPRLASPDMAISVSAGQGEPLENLRKLTESPWAEIVLRAKRRPPTLAQCNSPDRLLANEHSPQIPPNPNDPVLSDDGVLLHTNTYVPD